jgi:hypothetical protein
VNDINENQHSIRAGEAYAATIASNAASKQALAKAGARLRQFAGAMKLARVSCTRQLGEVFELLHAVQKSQEAFWEQRQGVIDDTLAQSRAEQLRLQSELRREAEAELRLLNEELSAFGFEPLEHDLCLRAQITTCKHCTSP